MPKTDTTKFNWNALRTKILVIVISVPLAFIAGYFYSIKMHDEARADVVSDIQVVTPLKAK